MRSIALAFVMAMVVTAAVAQDRPVADKDGFFSLFDGKSLAGWKAAEKPDTFKVEDGLLVVFGDRAHLFYDGPVANHSFKNFHFKAEVKTFPKANSGIYFHTEFQDKGWPSKGFECQVNATHSDRKKTGGLYAIKDVLDNAPNKDEQWFVYEIIVQGNKVTLKIDGKVTTEWEQAADYAPPKGMEGRKIGTGTIAIQGHDPKSKVQYKNIMIRPLD